MYKLLVDMTDLGRSRKMDKLHSFAWYAARIAPKLPKKAFKPVPGRLWGGLAYLLIVIAAFSQLAYFNYIRFSIWELPLCLEQALQQWVFLDMKFSMEL